MAGEPGCETHQVFIYYVGGTTVLTELTDVTFVEWNRIRDDISSARITVGYGCCEYAGAITPLLFELHLRRNGVDVWEGIITRAEFDDAEVRFYAEDLVWVTRKRALEQGYDYRNSSPVKSAVEHVEDLLLDQCYGRYGDFWNMVPGLNKVLGPEDPTTSRQVNSWQFSVWEELEHAARYNGIDYVMVNRDLFWFDIHYAWNILDDLEVEHLADQPRIVEYGNQFANRVIRTDGSGYAGIATAPGYPIDEFGKYIDLVSTESTATLREGPPTATETARWVRSAKKQIVNRYPVPQSVLIPANSTLLPTSPWNVDELMPGSWFQVQVDVQCRSVEEWQRLNEVKVTEEGGQQEVVRISCSTAPSNQVLPT